MDDRRFDALARALGGASTRRSALGALAGLGLAGSAAREVDAKKKRRRCSPECATGQTCKQGTCTCDNGGAVCGASCCRMGQRCEGGACVDPAPQCLAAGAACKDTGVPCCEGTVCASGQGGKGDVACYIPAGGACATTAECAYDSTCKEGICVANPQPQPVPACVPSFPVTDDAVANGNALLAAWDAAKTASGTVIRLEPGTYAVPVTRTETSQAGNIVVVIKVGLIWQSGDVTLEACPGGTVTLTYADTYQFFILGGSVTLKGLTLDGSGSAANGVAAASTTGATKLTMDECTVTGFGAGGGAGVYATGANTTVSINGGNYAGNGNGRSLANDLRHPGSFVCTGSPKAERCQNLGASYGACGCTSSTCRPTFAATADAGANGKALQDAVTAAADGDTIVLGPGDYRFARTHGAAQAGLALDSKNLTIERCQPEAVVNLVCPQSLDADSASYCLQVGGATAPGSLTLTGVNVSADFTRLSSVVMALPSTFPATLVLEDVLVENATEAGLGAGVTTNNAMTIKDGVTIRVMYGQGAGDSYALSTYGPNGKVTCEVPPKFQGYTSPCPSAVSEGCGCP